MHKVHSVWVKQHTGAIKYLCFLYYLKIYTHSRASNNRWYFFFSFSFLFFKGLHKHPANYRLRHIVSLARMVCDVVLVVVVLLLLLLYWCLLLLLFFIFKTSFVKQRKKGEKWIKVTPLLMPRAFFFSSSNISLFFWIFHYNLF